MLIQSGLLNTRKQRTSEVSTS